MEKHRQADFAHLWHELQREVHATAREKGWWDADRNNGEMLALMHSELSECLEALRHGNPPSEHIPTFSGAEEELADVVIRIMDMALARGWDVPGAVLARMQFNATRPRKHGGKDF